MPSTVNIPVQTYNERLRQQRERMNNSFQNRPATDSGMRLPARISNTFKRLSENIQPSKEPKESPDSKIPIEKPEPEVEEKEYSGDQAPQVLILDSSSGTNAEASPYLYNPVTAPYLPENPQQNPIPRSRQNIPASNEYSQPRDMQNTNNNIYQIPAMIPTQKAQNLAQNFNQNLTSGKHYQNPVQQNLPQNLPQNSSQRKSSSMKKGNEERTGSYKRAILYSLLGFGGFALFDPIVDTGLNSLLKLKDGGLVADNWKNLPLPINACFYLFELKNGRQFSEGAKPHLSEVGPFCYDEYKDKYQLEWSDDKVRYKERFRFNFRPGDSKSLDTVVEVLNYPLMVVVQLAKYLLKTLYLTFTSPLVMNLIMTLMRATDEKLIEQRTAREMLEGRKLKLVEVFDALVDPLRGMGIPIPGIGVGFYMLNNASFGFVALRKITEFGPYEVYTETKDGHSVGQFYTFDNKKKLEGFSSPCNRLAGGEGVFFGDNFKGSELNIFNQHLCRTVTLTENGTSFRTGAPLRRFTVPHDAYDSSLPSNKCYCPKGRTKRQCSGMSDMAPCFGGVQLYLSFPHFLYSSERQKQFEGLRPDPEKHQGEIVLEDRLGAPIYVSLAGQVNVHVEPFSYVAQMRNIPQVPFPMFWINEGLELAKPLEIVAGFGSNTLKFGSWAFLAAGMGAGGISAYRTRRRNKRIMDDR